MHTKIHSRVISYIPFDYPVIFEINLIYLHKLIDGKSTTVMISVNSGWKYCERKSCNIAVLENSDDSARNVLQRTRVRGVLLWFVYSVDVTVPGHFVIYRLFFRFVDPNNWIVNGFSFDQMPCSWTFQHRVVLLPS